MWMSKVRNISTLGHYIYVFFYIFSHSGILQYPLLFWEGFAQDFGSLLKGLAPIYPPECYQGQLLMFGDKVWLTVGVPDHPKGVISYQNRGKHFFMDLALCRGVLQKKSVSKLLPRSKVKVILLVH